MWLVIGYTETFTTGRGGDPRFPEGSWQVGSRSARTGRGAAVYLCVYWFMMGLSLLTFFATQWLHSFLYNG